MGGEVLRSVASVPSAAFLNAARASLFGRRESPMITGELG